MKLFADIRLFSKFFRTFSASTLPLLLMKRQPTHDSASAKPNKPNKEINWDSKELEAKDKKGLLRLKSIDDKRIQYGRELTNYKEFRL